MNALSCILQGVKINSLVRKQVEINIFWYRYIDIDIYVCVCVSVCVYARVLK